MAGQGVPVLPFTCSLHLCLDLLGYTCRIFWTRLHAQTLAHLYSTPTWKERKGQCKERLKSGRRSLLNGRNSSHASGQRCSLLGCVEELLFSFLQMVSAHLHVNVCICHCLGSESLPAVLMEVVALNTQKCLCCFSPLSSSAGISQEQTYSLLIKSQEGNPRGPWLFLQLVCALELTASLHTVQCS